MAGYLEEQLERRMEKDQQKSTLADQFVGERRRNIEGGHGGYGRANLGVRSLGVKLEPRGHDRKMHP